MDLEYSNVIDFIQKKAQEERDSCDPRCSRQAGFKAQGMGYAAGVISGRIDEIKESITAWKEAASEKPLDAQGHDDRFYYQGIVAGLEKALVILGIETEKL